MSRAKSIETAIAILEAFHEEPTWKQAELARRIGVRVETVKGYLEAALQQGLLPLVKDDDPPDVYWCIPKDTFAGELLLSREEVGELIRLLARSPASEGRDRLIKVLLRNAPDSSRALPATAWMDAPIGARDESILKAVEDAISHGRAVQISYYASSNGSVENREVSFQRIVPGTPFRTSAVCHRHDQLRWFRLDGVLEVLPSDAQYRTRPPEEVEAFHRASVDGYHDGGEPEEVRFFVRDPEARWVRRNLMPPMEATSVPGGIEVYARTAGLPQVARYVVALGAAARPLTSTLAARVRELAEGALSTARDQD